MRNKIIIGNWKMNKDANETKQFFAEFNKTAVELKDNLIYGVAVPSVNIATAVELAANGLQVVAQDVSQHESGAYTGECSAKMLASNSVKYVIIGHSERRQYHGETNEIINAKAKAAIANGLVPIICVGELLDEYEAGKSKEVIKKQITESLSSLNHEEIVVAYEPVWAIGTGKTATFEYAQEMCKYIRELTSEKLLIQYGGSVNGDNINKLLEQNDIDGALVGGASLEVASFIKLIQK
ncbi:MAG: triose-phosphate isomerase [Mycoplasma sp.]